MLVELSTLEKPLSYILSQFCKSGIIADGFLIEVP